MAKGRTRSRMELREQYDAAEAREREKEEGDGDEPIEVSDEPAESDDAIKPVKKKKKAATKESKPRKKTVKHVRQRIVWVVYDNSNKVMGKYDYPKKAEAEEHAARLATEKKATYYVQPVKEEIKD